MNILAFIKRVFNYGKKNEDPCSELRKAFAGSEERYLTLQKEKEELAEEYNMLLAKEKETVKQNAFLSDRIKDLGKSEYLLKESQRIAHFGHYIYHIESAGWETSDTLDKILGIDNTYQRNFNTWMQLISPEERTEMSDFFKNQILLKREPFDKECRIIRFSDKEVRCVHCLGNLNCNEEGKPVDVFGVIQDITERKLMQEKLQKDEQLKTILYERLNEAQKNAKIGSWEWDLKADCMWWSDELYRIFETSPEEHIPTVESNKKFFLPDDNKQYYEAAGRSIKTGEPLNYVVRIITSSGALKYCHSTGKVYYGNDGEPLRFNGTFMDITSQKQYEEELKKKNEDLLKASEKARESDRLKTVFLQNMSHEIRTPMNAIMGFSELLAENFDNKEKLMNFTSIIRQRSADLLELINDILDLSKIETGQLPVHKEKFNLSEFFKDLHKFFLAHRQKIKKTHIDIIVESCSDQAIITDKVKLKQIFINLIHNALKFTSKGYVKFGCTEENGKLVFFVSDTGIGIPADKHSVIFERFVQLDSSYKNVSGGTGLGLSIVKGLIELLQGEITLTSEPGTGSTFTFSVPYQPSGPILVKHKKDDRKKIDWHQYTALIVEDDQFNLEYLNELLKETGIITVNAVTGNEAIGYLKSIQSIDVVLLDIQLPDQSGYEVVRIMKGMDPEIKVIAQTAYASEEDRRKSLESGCKDYISKPIQKDILISKVKEIIEKEKV